MRFLRSFAIGFAKGFAVTYGPCYLLSLLMPTNRAGGRPGDRGGSPGSWAQTPQSWAGSNRDPYLDPNRSATGEYRDPYDPWNNPQR